MFILLRTQRVAVIAIKHSVASRRRIGALAALFTPVACAQRRKYLVRVCDFFFFFAAQSTHLRNHLRRQCTENAHEDITGFCLNRSARKNSPRNGDE